MNNVIWNRAQIVPDCPIHIWLVTQAGVCFASAPPTPPPPKLAENISGMSEGLCNSATLWAGPGRAHVKHS